MGYSSFIVIGILYKYSAEVSNGFIVSVDAEYTIDGLDMYENGGLNESMSVSSWLNHNLFYLVQKRELGMLN